MKKLLLATVAVLALTTAANATVTFQLSNTDSDETKLFFDKPSLTPISGGDKFQSSDIKNNGTDNVNIFTLGSVSNLGNGFGSIDGTNTGSDFLEAVTFVPGKTSFDGIFFRGQLQVLPGITADPNNGEVVITVTGVDGSVTTLKKSSLGIEEDITDLGIESVTDKLDIKSVTIAAGPGEYFKEFKQVQLSGVGVPGGVPEPATWIELILGFGLVGFMIRALPRMAAKRVQF